MHQITRIIMASITSQSGIMAVMGGITLQLMITARFGKTLIRSSIN
ncbi:MAG: hypothetical protein ACTSVV_13225 [Promethearchaeota archaeon]